MERRKFVIGLGSLAAGGAAAVGSGAFSTASADRTVDIETVDDADGLLGLEPGMDSDIIRAEGSPEMLTLEFEELPAEGINADATTQFGYAYDADHRWDDGNPEDECLFTITNLDSEPHDITVEYDWEDYTNGGGVLMALSHDGETQMPGNQHGNSYITVGNSYPGNPTVNDVGSGETVYVSVRYYIDQAEEFDLSGEMMISAD